MALKIIQKNSLQSHWLFTIWQAWKWTKIQNSPEGVYRKIVPKSEYAVFTVNGNNANGEIGQAFHYIYNVWLPSSDYCIDEELLFDFEYYDERWDCQLQTAQMDIYIPIKKLEG